MKTRLAVPVFFLANVFCVACSSEYSESSASTSDYGGGSNGDMNYASSNRRRINRLQYLQQSSNSNSANDIRGIT
jgi:hypothetical protein